MKRFLCSLLCLGVLAVSLPVPGRPNYNFISHTFYCDSARGCRHEIGHWMDDELGHPSRSIEFSDALKLYLYLEFGNSLAQNAPISEHAWLVMNYVGLLSYDPRYKPPGIEMFSSPIEELYADMYLYADGDVDAIPPGFQKFYSKDEKYQSAYECLTAHRFNLCSNSVSFMEIAK
jgi:hypothetical protein